MIFTVFQIFGPDFFLNGFPIPFIVHCRPSVLSEPNFYFSLMVFVHMRHFDIDFVFFLNFFYLILLEMVFQFTPSPF